MVIHFLRRAVRFIAAVTLFLFGLIIGIGAGEFLLF